jgi:hypothetical protein
MAERKVVPFDEFYYQLKLMYLLQKQPVCNRSTYHRQHSTPIERKLLCIFPVFLETHPPQAARGRCGFIKIKIAETYAKI